MMQDTLEDFKQKHFENYKNAVLEILKNNSRVLFEDDVLSLLQRPPLDSMDVIKCKFLEIAKKNRIIIQDDKLNKILDDYRKSIVSCIKEWKKIRIETLEPIIFSFQSKKDSDIIKFNKKDFVPLNRKLKKKMKEDILSTIDKKIVNNVNSLFTKDTPSSLQESIALEMTKFVQKNYVKQLLESIDFKIIVKDTTLINGVREQGERFLFTKMNSYLLNEDKLSES